MKTPLIKQTSLKLSRFLGKIKTYFTNRKKSNSFITIGLSRKEGKLSFCLRGFQRLTNVRVAAFLKHYILSWRRTLKVKS